MLKKLVTFLVLIFVVFSHAQIKKGRIFVGGQFQIQNKFNKSESKIYLNLIPSIGFMLSNRVGIQLNLSYSNADYNSERYYSSYSDYFYRTFSGSLSIPIVFPFSDKFYFYVAPSIGLINSNRYSRNYYNNGNSFSDYNTVFASRITPGLVYFPHPKVSVNFALGGIMSFDYSFRYTYGLIEILNLSSSMPTLGVSIWFGKVE